MEADEANLQIALARHATNSQRAAEAAKEGNHAGSEAIKAITLLNGGAAVAILAFIGHLASSGVEQETVQSLSRPLGFFVAGTFLAVFATGIGYFAQSCNVFALKNEFKKLDHKADTAAQDKEKRNKKCWGAAFTWRTAFKCFNSLAIICSMVALIFFGVACYQAYDAFSKIGCVKENARQNQDNKTI